MRGRREQHQVEGALGQGRVLPEGDDDASLTPTRGSFGEPAVQMVRGGGVRDGGGNLTRRAREGEKPCFYDDRLVVARSLY